jgi:hypothetical protein
MSPNIIHCLENIKQQTIILITSIDINDPKSRNNIKTEFVKKIKNNGSVLSYPKEEIDNTLIRISGPFFGFVLSKIISESIKTSNTNSDLIIKNAKDSVKKVFDDTDNISGFNSLCGLDHFTINLTSTKKLILCCDAYSFNIVDNIRYKMIEGAMIDTHKISYVNLCHGMYQYIQHWREKHKDHSIWFITKNSNIFHQKAVTLFDKSNTFVTLYDDNDLPLKLEIISNKIIIGLLQRLEINQKDWPGKKDQSILYDII